MFCLFYKRIIRPYLECVQNVKYLHKRTQRINGMEPMYFIFFVFRSITQQTHRASTRMYGILCAGTFGAIPQHDTYDTRFCCLSTFPSVPGPKVSLLVNFVVREAKPEWIPVYLQIKMHLHKSRHAWIQNPCKILTILIKINILKCTNYYVWYRPRKHAKLQCYQ